MYIFGLVLPVLYYLYVLCCYISKICRRNNMWPFSRTFRSDILLDGKTVVITGGNGGIGKETVQDLYKRGARVILLCRDQQKARSAIEEIKNEIDTSNGELILKPLDLSNLQSVRECAAEILKEETKIDVLINNAGILCSPERNTADGFEMHFGVNYLAHFLLTILLLPIISKAESARIVNVSSTLHKWYYVGGKINFDDLNLKNNFSASSAYCQSKLAIVMFSKELAKKCNEHQINNVTTYSLHPGVIATELGRNFDQFVPGASWLWNHLSKWVCKTPKQGAQTTLYCALDTKLTNQTGRYYDDCSEASAANLSMDEVACGKLWDVSMELLNLKNPFMILSKM